MNFRTEFCAKKSLLTLNPEHPVVLMGSCFAQNIKAKMDQCGWRAFNPGSTLFNPVSIATAIRLFCDTESGHKKFEDSLFSSQSTTHSWLFGSSFSSAQPADAIAEFRLQQQQFISALESHATLVFTFGTAIVYYLKENELPVGNCHKQHPDLFSKKRLSAEEICEVWFPLITLLQERYPSLEIIFTVSPVRHLKDGFTENSLSKATLLLAEEKICKSFSRCHYFPAFEILNDDLRDYRFYASDLAHPSETAIEYVWQKFKDMYLDGDGLQILKQGEKAFKAASHRPLTGALGKPLSDSPLL